MKWKIGQVAKKGKIRKPQNLWENRKIRRLIGPLRGQDFKIKDFKLITPFKKMKYYKMYQILHHQPGGSF